MMEQNLSDVLNNSKYMTIATVCEDGSPWCTPLGWFAFDAEKEMLVFDNHLGTVHADNLVRDLRCFITIVNYDQEHSRSVHIKTVAHKLTGQEYEDAKKMILDRGLNVTNDIFAAPIGEIDERKSKTGAREDGSLRFHCYMIYKEEK